MAIEVRFEVIRSGRRSRRINSEWIIHSGIPCVNKYLFRLDQDTDDTVPGSATEILFLVNKFIFRECSMNKQQPGSFIAVVVTNWD